MALIKCPDCGKDVSDVAPVCPNCGRPISAPRAGQGSATGQEKKTSPKVIGCLALLLLGLGLWVIGSLTSNGPSSSPSSGITNPPLPTEPQLELVKYTWHTEYGYAILEGQVRNISSQALEHVAAVASYYDANGDFITSSDTLIKFNPILPGQTSPFSVMTTENPAMKKARVEFKELMGGTISFRNAESKKGTKK